MARIRSIHPGLFTDEAFVSCSPLARVLVLGLWTEADDHGVFEWKPITLRMRLLAADAAAIEPLLDELRANNLISKETWGDKAYGLVRNFCRYQRPKKPTYRVELPSSLRSYVGLDADGERPDHSRNPHHTPTTSPPPPGKPVKSAQVKEGGGRRKGKEGGESKSIDKPVVVVATEPVAESGTTTTEVLKSDFEEVGSSPPKQTGAGLGTPLPADWTPDDEGVAFAKSIGMDDSVIQTELERFHAYNVERGTFSPDWLGTWRSFCGVWKRRQPIAPAAKAPARIETSAPYNPTIAEWEHAVERWKSNNSLWSRQFGPEPGMPGCRCPAPLLVANGIDPANGRALPAQVSA